MSGVNGLFIIIISNKDFVCFFSSYPVNVVPNRSQEAGWSWSDAMVAKGRVGRGDRWVVERRNGRKGSDSSQPKGTGLVPASRKVKSNRGEQPNPEGQ